MEDKEARQEYLRRNLIVAKAIGIKAGLHDAVKRLEQQRRPPKWLVNTLKLEQMKMLEVCNEAVIHRDEVYDSAWNDAF